MRVFKSRQKKTPRQTARNLMIALIVLVVFAVGCVLYGTMSYYQQMRQTATHLALKQIEQGQFAKATALLTKAADVGDMHAIEFMTWLDLRRGNYERALQYARECSTKVRSLTCMEAMADLAVLGYGRATGAKAAISFMTQAVQGDVIKGYRQISITSMLERALPLCNDPNDHLELVRFGLQNSSPMSYLYMGDKLFLGDGLDKNPPEAVYCWQEALKMGVEEANTRLAGCYWHGYGLPRDPALAMEYYTKSANAGDPVAYYSLALIALSKAREGDINDENYRMGKALLQNACDIGYGPAASALGILMLTEDPYSGVSKVSAAQYFNQAYTLMDTTGSVLLALQMYAGVGVEKDEGQALAVLFEEAQSGSRPADDLLSALSGGTDARLLLNQIAEVCRQILLSKISFRAGSFEAQSYHDNQEHPGNYYQEPDDEYKEQMAKLGVRYPQLVNTRSFMVGGNPLLLPSIDGILVQSAPSTGARMYAPSSNTPTLPAPPVPEDYDGTAEALDAAFDRYFDKGGLPAARTALVAGS